MKWVIIDFCIGIGRTRKNVSVFCCFDYISQNVNEIAKISVVFFDFQI